MDIKFDSKLPSEPFTLNEVMDLLGNVLLERDKFLKIVWDHYTDLGMISTDSSTLSDAVYDIQYEISHLLKNGGLHSGIAGLTYSKHIADFFFEHDEKIEKYIQDQNIEVVLTTDDNYIEKIVFTGYEIALCEIADFDFAFLEDVEFTRE